MVSNCAGTKQIPFGLLNVIKLKYSHSSVAVLSVFSVCSDLPPR